MDTVTVHSVGSSLTRCGCRTHWKQCGDQNSFLQGGLCIIQTVHICRHVTYMCFCVQYKNYTVHVCACPKYYYTAILVYKQWLHAFLMCFQTRALHVYIMLSYTDQKKKRVNNLKDAATIKQLKWLINLRCLFYWTERTFESRSTFISNEKFVTKKRKSLHSPPSYKCQSQRNYHQGPINANKN